MDECPNNRTEFETAAKRRNCTGNTRYLCAPDKYLTSLIEFCTDQKKSLYGKGGIALRFIMSLKLQFHFEVMQDDIDQNKKKAIILITFVPVSLLANQGRVPGCFSVK